MEGSQGSGWALVMAQVGAVQYCTVYSTYYQRTDRGRADEREGTRSVGANGPSFGFHILTSCHGQCLCVSQKLFIFSILLVIIHEGIRTVQNVPKYLLTKVAVGSYPLAPTFEQHRNHDRMERVFRCHPCHHARASLFHPFSPTRAVEGSTVSR
jgi:hypothetical protein